MKKVIVFLAAICLVFGVAGNAAADFTYGAMSSLTLSIYDSSTETGWDFGVIDTDIDLSTQGQHLTTIDLSVFATDATVSLYSTNTDYSNWFGVTQSTTPRVNGGGILGSNSAMRDIWLFGYANGSSPVTVDPSGPKTASSLLKSNGTYQGFVIGGEQPSLEDVYNNGFLDIYLYRYDLLTLNKGYDDTTDYQAVVRINADGSVMLNPVPVPGALVLICTGLLGALGIKRRKA